MRCPKQSQWTGKAKMMTTIMSNGDNEGDDDGDACHDSDDDYDVYLSWLMWWWLYSRQWRRRWRRWNRISTTLITYVGNQTWTNIIITHVFQFTRPLSLFTSTMLARRYRCEQQDVIVAVTSARRIRTQSSDHYQTQQNWSFLRMNAVRCNRHCR